MAKLAGRNRKRSLCAGLLVCALGGVLAPAARAGFITFDPDGSGPAPAQQIAGLDFSVGNVLGGGLASSTVGQSVEIYYQANLAGVINTNGVTVSPAGLNGTPGAPAYEITAVSRVTATVTGIVAGPNGTTRTFILAPVQVNPFVELWYDPTSNANDLAGTGFNNGVRILHGVPASTAGNTSNTTDPAQAFDQFGPNNYPTKTSVVALGSEITNVNLTGVNGVDSSFFVTPVSSAAFNTSLIDPFQQVDPSGLFSVNPNGVAPSTLASNIGAINGQSGPDWQLQADANMSFTAVPEPASIGLIALSALAAMPRKKRR